MVGLIILLVIFFVVLLPLIILVSAAWEYALKSFALWRIAKQAGMQNPKNAWIPFVRYRFMGECAMECHEQLCLAQGIAPSTKKPWNWGKILLVLRIVYVGVLVLALPLGIVLMFFGGSLLFQVLSWVAVAMTVATAVCSYKIFRYYLEDPYDVLVLVLTALYPSWLSVALLLVSFFKPRVQDGAAANIAAEKTPTQEQPIVQNADAEDAATVYEGVAVVQAAPDGED